MKRAKPTHFDHEAIIGRLKKLSQAPYSLNKYLRDNEGMNETQAKNWITRRRKERRIPLAGESWFIQQSDNPQADNAFKSSPLSTLELLEKGNLNTQEAIDLCFRQAEQSRKFSKAFNSYTDEVIEVEIEDDVFMLGISGDDHNGSQATDHLLNQRLYRLIVEEVALYWIQNGDIIDMLFPGDLYTLGEQSLNMQNQAVLTFLLVSALAESRKMIARVQSQHSQHDSFGRKQTGIDLQGLQRLYDKFNNREVIPTFKNKGWVRIKHGDNVHTVYIAHQKQARSMYHDLQPAIRIEREEGQGADIINTAHTHKPSTMWRYNDSGRPVYFANSGTAKREKGDTYIDTNWSAGVFGPSMYIFDKRFEKPFTHFFLDQALDHFRMLKQYHQNKGE